MSTYDGECRICETPIIVKNEIWGGYEYCDNHDPSDEPNYDEQIGFEASMRRKHPLRPGFTGN